jgi:hypothetical protein
MSFGLLAERLPSIIRAAELRVAGFSCKRIAADLLAAGLPYPTPPASRKPKVCVCPNPKCHSPKWNEPAKLVFSTSEDRDRADYKADLTLRPILGGSDA